MHKSFQRLKCLTTFAYLCVSALFLFHPIGPRVSTSSVCLACGLCFVHQRGACLCQEELFTHSQSGRWLVGTCFCCFPLEPLRLLFPPVAASGCRLLELQQRAPCAAASVTVEAFVNWFRQLAFHMEENSLCLRWREGSCHGNPTEPWVIRLWPQLPNPC